MKPSLIYILLLLILLSCSNDTSNSSSVEIAAAETPEVEVADLAVSYRRQTLVGQLFEEAVDADKQLENLVELLDETREMMKDSMEAYNKYSEINEQYWDELENYSHDLSDSVMRAELEEFIDSSRKRHKENTAQIDNVSRQIESAEKELKDLEILMKIMVTREIMDNFQQKNIPSKQPLDATLSALDSAKEQVKPYTSY